MAKLRIKLIRSQIGSNPGQRRTVKALGLNRVNGEVEHDDSPTIRGMVHKVRHLISVKTGEES